MTRLLLALLIVAALAFVYGFPLYLLLFGASVYTALAWLAVWVVVLVAVVALFANETTKMVG